MKVLIIGNQISLMKSLAYRFYKEGNKIYIISDNYIELDFKYKYYKYILKENKLNQIFKKDVFDKVIYINEKENISGLINVLTLCSKYKIDQFINVSSMYDNEIDSGEVTCKYFKDICKVNIALLKVSTIYGKGAKEEYKDTLIFNIFKNLSKNKEKEYSKTRVKDYIEVNDVAETVILSCKNSLSGTYVIRSGEELSDNELYRLSREIYDNKNLKEIKKENFSDKEFINKTNFKTKYSLNEELKNIFNEINLNKQNVKYTREGKQNLTKSFYKKTKPYIENISLFLILMLVSYFFNKNNMTFMNLDIKLIYIVIVGISYGSKQALISAILSCLLVVGEDLSKGISIISIFAITESLIQLVIYPLVGIYVGYRSDSKNNQIKQLKLNAKNSKDEYKFLYRLYTDTYKEKNEVEDKLINTKDGFGKVYGAISKIDSLEKFHTLKSSIDILEEFLDNKNIAIYSLKNEYLRLHVKSNNKKFNPKSSIRIDELKEVTTSFKKGDIFINKDFNINLPDMAAPIKDEGEIVGVITIEKVEFSKMNLYYQNLFKVITNIIESFIVKTYKYEKLTLNDRYIDNTIFLNHKEFKKNLEIRRSAKSENKINYVLLKILNKENLKELSDKINSCIRYIDFTGVDKEENIYVVLLNTTKDIIDIPIKRLSDLGIQSEVVDEVEIYA